MTDSNGDPVSPPPRPSRMEAEIAEILERSEQQPASFTEHVRRKTANRPPARPPVTPSVMPSLPSLNNLGPGSFWIGALLFALLGAFTSGVSPLLGVVFGLVSIASFIMIWVRRAPPGIGETKMWRGRPLSTGPESPEWVRTLRDRFRGPPRF